ncbi:peptidase M28 domain-containing protein [Tieghemostelium lacteum]|uniref:Carboxypeptidase Q n=1 Tax=Tieghemostelium lacteum TaxID=361077 RepID=A0A152A0N9_TIELA|nr:peptidase M28 domain-containing protein [Tieghemostelium lacteum]|eukprot:KYQ99779.1 peptidase M28 domain-containing protein [Tieghemostelium lacteum]
MDGVDKLQIEDELLLPHDINPKSSGFKVPFSTKFKQWFANNRWKCLIGAILLVTACIVIPVAIKKSKEGPKQELSYQCSELGVQAIQLATSQLTGAYGRLTQMCTQFGNRLSGSQSLENAITWLQGQMIKDGFENVQTQQVSVTNWKRGNEWASMQAPYFKKMNILGLGGSISTNGTNVTLADGSITGQVVVVSNFTQLDEIGPSGIVNGKIVLFNAVFVNYSSTVAYRVGGAVAAAQYGAIAALVRSVTPYSLGTPHTGGMHYQQGVTQIPTAAVTLEDADLIQGLVDMGENVTVNLYMEAQTLPNAISRNVMGEITGSEYPDQVVVIGGHIDSWDVGQGAVDDGGGVMVAYETLVLLKALGIQPKRTIRMVAWTNEENGAAGSVQYQKEFGAQTFFSIETDNGVTTPQGMTVSGLADSDLEDLQSIANTVIIPYLGGPYNIFIGETGTDNEPLLANAPGGNFAVDMSQYFWFHHSEGDALNKINQTQLDQCVGVMAALSVCIANYNTPLTLVSTSSS